MISVQGLSKQYAVKIKEPGLKGSLKSLFKSKTEIKLALKNASFKVESGEILGLIGANGAGKTTLVKMLSGIMEPTAGTAQVLGYSPWERKSEFKKQISVIMGQKAQLWWDLPAHDCFLLLKQIYQIPDKVFELQFNNLVDILGVSKQLNIQIRRLSLGERMKMELIAALLHSPRVIYLDEPTIGLDLAAQTTVRGFLQEYQKKYAPCMILTSHYMEDIEKLCKRVMILRQGEIIFDGSLQSIMTKFSTHKNLKISVKSDLALDERQFALQADQKFEAMGLKYTKQEDGLLLVSVPKQNLSSVASAIFSQFEVADMSIAEEDLSDVIEKILKGTNLP